MSLVAPLCGIFLLCYDENETAATGGPASEALWINYGLNNVCYDLLSAAQASSRIEGAPARGFLSPRRLFASWSRRDGKPAR